MLGLGLSLWQPALYGGSGGPFRLADGTTSVMDAQFTTGMLYINGTAVSMASALACTRASDGYAETAGGFWYRSRRTSCAEPTRACSANRRRRTFLRIQATCRIRRGRRTAPRLQPGQGPTRLVIRSMLSCLTLRRASSKPFGRHSRRRAERRMLRACSQKRTVTDTSNLSAWRPALGARFMSPLTWKQALRLAFLPGRQQSLGVGLRLMQTAGIACGWRSPLWRLPAAHSVGYRAGRLVYAWRDVVERRRVWCRDVWQASRDRGLSRRRTFQQQRRPPHDPPTSSP